MKYLFVFLLLGLTSVANAQTETAKQPNCDDIEGFQTEHFDLVPENYTGVAYTCVDDKVEVLGHYKDGIKDGLFRSWWNNGQLEGEGHYKDGDVFGLVRSWHRNGKLEAEINTKDGKMDGLSRSWHPNGQLGDERNYKSDQQEGLQRSWYSNGQLKQETNVKDGKQDRVWKKWYENGQLWVENNYKNGMPDGLVREWYENGQLSYEKNWKEGKEDGLSRGWYENGHLRYEMNFKDGEPISEKRWDENGKVSTTGSVEIPFSEMPDTHIGPHNLLVFDDYDKGLAYAKKVQKPVFLDFSGHACVNSRKMEHNVWGAPGVIEILRNQLVVISLFVDDRTELPSDEQKMITDYRGRKVKLTTYGQKWSNLQVSRYKTNTQPYYRMLSPDGEDLSNGPGDYERHKTPQKFKAWLIKGLE